MIVVNAVGSAAAVAVPEVAVSVKVATAVAAAAALITRFGANAAPNPNTATTIIPATTAQKPEPRSGMPCGAMTNRSTLIAPNTDNPTCDRSRR